MRGAIALLMLIAAAEVPAAPCTFAAWTMYRNTTLYRHPEAPAYLFQTSAVKVDADGAPNAYHPDDLPLHCTKGSGFKGLDCPANAGYPGSSWWRSALLPDPARPDVAYVQPAPSPFAGYFVSQTSLFDRTRAKTDTARYVDSRTVPYLVFPGQFHAMPGTGSLGDLGFAFNVASGRGSPFIVAEVGPPAAALGEMSIALATALGGKDPQPRTGAGVPVGTTLYVVFPRSRATPAWPLSMEQLTARTDSALQAIGGLSALKSCASVP